jgi:hypothetical protein
VIRRVLPRGPLDFARQLLIWFGFVFGYQLVRGSVDHDRRQALADGLGIVRLERHLFGALPELRLQRLVDASHWLSIAAAWTYWNSEFTVVSLALLWVYLRRYESFKRLRNTVVLAGLLALPGFAFDPTAPPRMYPALGFRDTVASTSGVNHGSGLVQLAHNPYAAMPSLHSADALVVAIVLVRTSRRRWSRAAWALWPAWVWFCVMATANHFLLDVLAGVALALLALTAVAAAPTLGSSRAAGRARRGPARGGCPRPLPRSARPPVRARSRRWRTPRSGSSP